MNNNRKLLVVALIFLTILLGVVSIFLSQQLQMSQAPTSSGAEGFGESANKTLFDEVQLAFEGVTCDFLFSEDDLTDLEDLPPILSNPQIFITTDVPQEKLPKFCTYDLGRGVTAHLSVHTYDENSVIDPSEEALFERINTEVIAEEIIDSGEEASSKYFYGHSSLNASNCQTTMFHKRNDFEYIGITYDGLRGCQSDTSMAINSTLVTIVAQKVASIMTGINR